MAKGPTATSYNAAFCTVVKRLREKRGFTQLQMAAALGCELGTYQKYEYRTPLPHRYIVPFCAMMMLRPDELFNLVGQEAFGARTGKRGDRPAA